MRAKRRVTAMVNDDGAYEGWFAEGCKCPWQETEFDTWADAMEHAMRCQCPPAPVVSAPSTRDVGEQR